MALSEVELEKLKQCLKVIEQKVQLGSATEWKHNHFEILSEKIFRETGVQLSAITLKRVWGKLAYRSSPSISTLDALASFIGYDGWINYMHYQSKHEEKEPSNNRLTLPKNVLLISAFIVIIVVFLGFLFVQNDAKTGYNKEALAFDFKPITQGLPNTVTFTYDASNTLADSLFIQQSWDPGLRHKIDKGKHFFATTYYYPGHFKAKFIVNDEVVLQKNLAINSEGWLGTIEKDPVPVYIHEPGLFKTGVISITKEDLESYGFDLNTYVPITNLHLVDNDMDEVSGRNFEFKTLFRNTFNEGDAICQQTKIYILCTNKVYGIPFSIKGCVGELKLKLPDKIIKGNDQDLTAFGVDFSNWVKLKVRVSDDKIKIMINDMLAFQDTINIDPGRIVGFKYQFHGSGGIKSLSLQSMDLLTKRSTVVQSGF